MDNNVNNISFHAQQSDDSPAQAESFASLLEQSGGLPERLEPGQKVSAKIVSISGDFVYIDLGGKSEGIINLDEFRGNDGSLQIKEGDEIEAFFVTVQDGVRRLTTRIHGYSAVSLKAIRDAKEAGLPVNGTVRREIKGGFEVLSGEVRCFCPFSQIDIRASRETERYLGHSFPFMVLEFEEDGRNIILSRRFLLEQEKEAKIERLRQSLEVDMTVTAKVTSIQRFGAFVDLGGIEGLIPASEISWAKTENPGDVLSAGQEVTAKIVSLDWENNRFSLSIKALHPDPWESAAEKYPAGSRVNGSVVRLMPFGAFVAIERGIDGLVHISNLGTGRRINHPKEVIEVGQQVEAYVLSVDVPQRKISLSLQPKTEPKKIVLPQVGELFEGVVDKVMPFGVFIKNSSGLTGLIPNAEMATPAGSDHRRTFPAGTEIKAIVTETDSEKARVRLSRKALMEKEVQEEYREYISSSGQQEGQSGGLGSLGEILKSKLEEKNRSGA